MQISIGLPKLYSLQSNKRSANNKMQHSIGLIVMNSRELRQQKDAAQHWIAQAQLTLKQLEVRHQQDAAQHRIAHAELTLDQREVLQQENAA